MTSCEESVLFNSMNVDPSLVDTSCNKSLGWVEVGVVAYKTKKREHTKVEVHIPKGWKIVKAYFIIEKTTTNFIGNLTVNCE